ncbi:glycosyltransferase family 4 protein [Candidatus Falkowbacteria bacterium]|nr:MAG: glycosyltransferase family 4 protein [Candidatus Falkowbacteria bacterium]
MKTLFITLEFPPKVGGVENYYGKIAEYWPEELVVLTNNQNELISQKMPFLAWFKAFKPVRAAISQNNAVWLLVGEILPLGTVAWLLSYICPFRYAIMLHGLDFSLATKSFIKRFVSKQILEKASTVICANSHTAKEVKKTFPKVSNINVVNPGVEKDIPLVSSLEIENFKIKNNLEEAFILLSVGRLVKRKGVDMVLSALSDLTSHIPNLQYIIIGDGPEKSYLQNIIHQLGLENNVRILSDVNDEEKNKYFASCDIFIMTARNIDGDYEGFGIVYLEAGLFSKPVIAGSSGGVGEAVQNTINGLVVDEEDPNSIAKAIVDLYNNQALRKRLGEAGRERSLKQSWEQQVSKIYSLLS